MNSRRPHEFAPLEFGLHFNELCIDSVRSLASGPGEERALTAQGHPRAIFGRAIARGNLLAAEATARELGKITLPEALELTILISEQQPQRHPRVAARWLQRYLDEQEGATIDEIALLSCALTALTGPTHAHAAALLRGLAGG